MEQNLIFDDLDLLRALGANVWKTQPIFAIKQLGPWATSQHPTTHTKECGIQLLNFSELKMFHRSLLLARDCGRTQVD